MSANALTCAGYIHAADKEKSHHDFFMIKKYPSQIRVLQIILTETQKSVRKTDKPYVYLGKVHYFTHSLETNSTFFFFNFCESVTV